MALFGSLLGFLALIGWVYLTFLNGWFWQTVVDSPAPELVTWPAIAVVVPARDEAAMLPLTLTSLLEQDYPGEYKIFLIDDQSSDGTADIARKLAADKGMAEKLTVITAPPPEAGWKGKIAAMQLGVAQSDAPYILFTDADIAHPKHSLRRLAARSMTDRLDLNSLMVKLHCNNSVEEFLIPAFVFFFSMLYPFAKVNDPTSPVAGAAGGVMLVKRLALANASGLAAIRNALIDDCALARAIKDRGGDFSSGGRLRLALSEDTVSLRPYTTAAEIRGMVSRTAFAQLRYSNGLLAGTVAGMGLLFVLPVLLMLLGGSTATLFGVMAWLLMTIIYMPMVQFYGLSIVWAFTLPFAAAVYIAATLESAFQYWQGQGGQWKGRAQAS